MKIVIATVIISLSSILLIGQAGSLDFTFGVEGKVITDFEDSSALLSEYIGTGLYVLRMETQDGFIIKNIVVD